MTLFDDPNYDALFERAAAVRDHREAFEYSIKAGEVSLEAVFERAKADPVIASMKVLPAIEALPEAGKVQTRRAFEELGVSEAAHIADVGTDEVAQLPDALKKYAL